MKSDMYFIINKSVTRKKNIFVVPWGAALVRNCSANGQLLDFSTVKGYENQVKDDGRQLWLYLPLKIFRSDDSLFAVFCCSQCETMIGTGSLSQDQDPLQVAARLCIHSKVCSTLIDDWLTVWDISAEYNLVQNVPNDQ